MTSARVISTRRRSPPDSVYAGALRQRRQRQLRQQLAQPRSPRRAVEVQRLEDGEDVLLDRQSAEDRRLLRQVADALPGPDVHRIVGDVGVVQQDAARIRRGQPHDHRERRRLAGAVRPEQADDLARRDLELDALDHRATAVRLGEIALCAASPFSRASRDRQSWSSSPGCLLSGCCRRRAGSGAPRPASSCRTSVSFCTTSTGDPDHDVGFVGGGVGQVPAVRRSGRSRSS